MILHTPPHLPKYYKFQNLSKYSSLKHAVFTRDGGVSELNFKSLNAGLSVGDDKEKVYLNRETIAETMGVDKENCIYLNQVHGKEFLVLKESSVTEKNQTPLIIDKSKRDADGIITDIKGLLTVIQIADCQAVILYDPVKQVLANIHSGWRASIIDIIGRAVEIMAEQFSTNPPDIIASIAPSLGPCCAEFKNYQNEIPQQFWQYKLNKNYFDFWKISKDQLTAKGILEENIEIAGICTSCTTDIFYSYRKENITGRFAAAAGFRAVQF